ncbi:MAG TPA: peptide chain release factor N(5)-glutamine methyltransferase, partial [Clostridia bacterium]|nr:peptide chain release factor N(5)-glutamine methyltransferase [Clostridia bacterium]
AQFVQSDLFANIRERYDLIACNPPYLSDADMQTLQRELAFEPRRALYGGADGLDFYRALAREAMAFLNPGGALALEVGFGQAETVAALFAKTELTRDLNGVERVVTAYR